MSSHFLWCCTGIFAHVPGSVTEGRIKIRLWKILQKTEVLDETVKIHNLRSRWRISKTILKELFFDPAKRTAPAVYEPGGQQGTEPAHWCSTVPAISTLENLKRAWRSSKLQPQHLPCLIELHNAFAQYVNKGCFTASKRASGDPGVFLSIITSLKMLQVTAVLRAQGSCSLGRSNAPGKDISACLSPATLLGASAPLLVSAETPSEKGKQKSNLKQAPLPEFCG